ncbi:MAG TPA: hypothetical protein VD927_00425 [Chryseosolibacter sp.]|nr:hypothetical protein [Chryseosolibacter sp.]
MKLFKALPSLIFVAAFISRVFAQEVPPEQPVEGERVIIVTGARFSYNLVQRLIDEFNKEYPNVQIIIEARGSNDPENYDVLAEVYKHDEKRATAREYLYIARYAIVPIASSHSQFARIYQEKGLTTQLIRQIFFNNVFADHEDEEKLRAPFTVYTRFQKAGAPKVFADFYGFEQNDINGKAIAGSDEHLLKALLRDSTAISYLPMPVVYDNITGQVRDGVTVIPTDLDGNGKVKADERGFYISLRTATLALENEKKSLNIPVGYLHLSVDKQNNNTSLKLFLRWVSQNSDRFVKEYGYLKTDMQSSDNQQQDL